MSIQSGESTLRALRPHGRSAPTLAVCLAAALLGACGDSTTVPVETEPAPREVIAPPCANPAPLNGKPNPLREAYIVSFARGVNAQLESERLSLKYQLVPTTVFLFGSGGFAATITPQKLAALRCEHTVAAVEHDMLLTIALKGN